MVEKQEVKINDVRVADAVYDDSLPIAYREAIAHASALGTAVKSMPEVLVLKRRAPFNNPIWSTWYTCASEEDVGTTVQGNKVMIEVHGGGISTPERIETAHEKGLTKQNAAHLTENEVRDLLAGKLADGIQIPVYSFTDFREGVKDLPRRYAVVLDFDTAKATTSGYQDIQGLRDNPLVIMRAGGSVGANALIDYAAQRYNQYGNWHPFNAINADETQGRVLFVGDDGSGLLGDYGLNGSGRFLVGVAPEALVGTERHAQKSGPLLSTETTIIIAPTLDQIMAKLKPYVAPALVETIQANLATLYVKK